MRLYANPAALSIKPPNRMANKHVQSSVCFASAVMAARDITHNQIRRGSFRSVPELITAIEQYIAQHNRDPKLFIWTARSSGILEKVTRARRSLDKVHSF